jgi:sec-independent protein translocase protein TatC
MTDLELTVWDHIEELSQRLRRVLFLLIISTVIVSSIPSDFSKITSLDFSDYKPLISYLMEFLQDSLLPEEVTLIAFNWLDTFYIYFLLAFIMGIIITLPYSAYQIYSFVAPAMYSYEKSRMFKFIIVFVSLFSVGILYAYFILLPTTFKVLYNFVYQTRVMPFFSVKDFFGIVAFGLFGSGLFYTFPLIIYMLVKADLLELDTLREKRKEFFLVILIVTAFLTPDPSPFSMLLMTVPFYLLYEITIQVLSRNNRDQSEKELEMGLNASKELLERLRKVSD